MSECITRIEKIEKIETHPNADRLEVAHLKGWHCVVSKGTYKAGDLCVYFPIDSVIPGDLVEILFAGTKISLPKGRVKTIRLRGLYSQGLVSSLDTIGQYLGDHGKHFKLEEGLELTEALGVMKYEPKLPAFQQFQAKARRRNQNDNFKKYASIENFKNYNDIFAAEEQVVVTEKIHGTNFRAGWVKRKKPEGFFQALWFSARKVWDSSYSWEWAVGSHNVQLNPDSGSVYCEIAKKYNLREKLGKGESLYGEIYGPNIQKGYHYGKADGENDLVAFDVRLEDGYLTFDKMRKFVEEKTKVDVVPVLFRGKMKELDVEEIVLGDSIFDLSQEIREGAVIQTVSEETSGRLKNNRKKLKLISPAYLTRASNTDFH